MSKLVFAAAVLLVGLVIHGALRRRAEALPPGLRSVGSRVVLLLAIGVPAVILFFSVFRIIPAGHVGVKVCWAGGPTPPRGLCHRPSCPMHVVVMDGR
jgi:hypothetical protein